MLSWDLLLCGICLCFEWLHLPTVGGEGHLCRGFGVITHDSAGGEKLRGIVKGMEAHMASFGSGGLAECVQSIYKLKCPCNQKTLSLLLAYLTLLTPYYYRFPFFKVMGVCFLWPHFLLSLLLSCCSLFSVFYTKLINFLRKVTIYCSNYIRKGSGNTKQSWKERRRNMRGWAVIDFEGRKTSKTF